MKGDWKFGVVILIEVELVKEFGVVWMMVLCVLCELMVECVLICI